MPSRILKYYMSSILRFKIIDFSDVCLYNRAHIEISKTRLRQFFRDADELKFAVVSHVTNIAFSKLPLKIAVFRGFL